METMTTVPDMGLETHIFMKELQQGGGDVEAREVLHERIEAWLMKMHEWHGPAIEWVFKCDPLIVPDLQQLLLVGESASKTSLELKAAEKTAKEKGLEVENAYSKMMEKLVAKQFPEDVLLPRQASLASWKKEKLGALELSVDALRQKLQGIYVDIRKHMDHLIDVCQENDDDDDDPMMAELEVLMEGFTMEGLKGDSSKTFAKDEPPEEPGAEGSQHDAVMAATTPEETALKHISSMDEGPMKSALLALCEATVTKVGPNQWIIYM